MNKDGFQLESEVRPIVSKHFSIYDVNAGHDYLTFFVSLPDDEEKAFCQLRQELKKEGYLPILNKRGGEHTLDIIPGPESKKSRIIINVILLIVTFFSTWIVGTYHWMDYKGIDVSSYADPVKLGEVTVSHLPAGFLFFSLPLLLILGTHETAHYYYSKKHGVEATLPYFIPAPTLFGTFGAFISVKEPIPNRKALLDIGLAGPVAGLIVAIPVTLLGLYLSVQDPGQAVNIPEGGYLQLGTPLLYDFMTMLVPGTPEQVHPTAFAGWVGLFVTAINLLPAGQLDGGHIARAVLGDKSKYLSISAVMFLVALGFIFDYFGWFLFAILIMILGLKHQPPLNDISKLDGKRIFAGFVAGAIFAVCFVPVPIEMVQQDVGYDFLVEEENKTYAADFGSTWAYFNFSIENTGDKDLEVKINATALNWGSDFSLIEPGGNASAVPMTIMLRKDRIINMTLLSDLSKADPGKSTIKLQTECVSCNIEKGATLQIELRSFRANATATENETVFTVVNLLDAEQNISFGTDHEGDTWERENGTTTDSPITVTFEPMAKKEMRWHPFNDEFPDEVNFTLRSETTGQSWTHSLRFNGTA